MTQKCKRKLESAMLHSLSGWKIAVIILSLIFLNGFSYVHGSNTTSPSSQPSTQPSSLPSRQPSAKPSRQPSNVPSRQPSTKPSVQPSSRPTMQPSTHPSRQPSAKPSRQPTSLPSMQPSLQPSSVPSRQPSARPSMQPSSRPSMQPSSLPTMQPSHRPSAQPSSRPSTQPSNHPSNQPSSHPSSQPSTLPSSQPFFRPSNQPTTRPSNQPSLQPSCQPTLFPTSPTVHPSMQPSMQPTSRPSCQPSRQPSQQPAMRPSNQPSLQPTTHPSRQPSSKPSSQPSLHPSMQPSIQPSAHPSTQPSRQPSSRPSRQPSSLPSMQPSRQPTRKPSSQPSSDPSMRPSIQPSTHPTRQPSSQPSFIPSIQPSSRPSTQPSVQPSSQPTMQPGSVPSARPSHQPSVKPSTQPSSLPSMQPTIQPSMRPSSQPSDQPSCIPSNQPTCFPSSQPSVRPSIFSTAQPSHQPTSLPSMQPSVSPSQQPSSHPSVRPSMQPTAQPSFLPSAQPSVIPSTQPNACPSMQPTEQPSSLPTSQPSSQPSHMPSNHPSCQPSSLPSIQPSSQPAAPPTQQPSNQPSMQPSSQPSCQPSSVPSEQPSSVPSAQPSSRPTMQPSCVPSTQPSGAPSTQPSSMPSSQPSVLPTMQPSVQPSGLPSNQPSGRPSTQPSSVPSMQPSSMPSMQPSSQPSSKPSGQPSSMPSSQPSSLPSMQPSAIPSMQPSGLPSGQPSVVPSTQPSSTPSQQPSSSPSTQPSGKPSGFPSTQPSSYPSMQPSSLPSMQPSSLPSMQPSSQPSSKPSRQPSGKPSMQPSSHPTVQPSLQPSGVPSEQPSMQPSSHPSYQPTSQPSYIPSCQPSSLPSLQPQSVPSMQPSIQPSIQPSMQPSSQPSFKPSAQPSSIPSMQPSTQPSRVPSMQPIPKPSMQPSVQPSSLPSMQPSMQPSSKPTLQPFSRPSCQPSTQPSRYPSRQPSSRPSAQPSFSPSAALQWEINLNVKQTLLGDITRSQFVKDASAKAAFEQAVMDLFPNTYATRLQIENVTNVLSATTRRMLLHMNVNSNSVVGIQVTYNFSFIAQAVTSFNGPSQAFDSAVSTLSNAISSGAFNTHLAANTVLYNASTLQSIVASNSLYIIGSNYTYKIVHSAKPTSMPSRQPSGLPSSQPSMVPSMQPSMHPSSQPSKQPSSSPTSKPSFTITTKWILQTRYLFSNNSLLLAYPATRSLYYELNVNTDEHVYGSCLAWESYRRFQLTNVLTSKNIPVLQYSYQGGYLTDNVQQFTCHDESINREIITAVAASSSSSDNSSRRTFSCDGHVWLVASCQQNQLTLIQARQAGIATSQVNITRSLCIDCDDPCSQYTCVGSPGNRVLSPCTAPATANNKSNNATCGYLQGSLRYLYLQTEDYDEGGYEPVFIGSIISWFILLLATYSYDRYYYHGDKEKQDKIAMKRKKSEMKKASRMNTANSVVLLGANSSLSSLGSVVNNNVYSPTFSPPLDTIVVMSFHISFVQYITKHLILLSPEEQVQQQQQQQQQLHSSEYSKAKKVITNWLFQLCKVFIAEHDIAAIFQAPKRRMRYLQLLRLLTKLSAICMSIAVLVVLEFPGDDGHSCVSLTDSNQDCTRQTMIFDNHAHYCKWLDRTGLQLLYQPACQWKLRRMTIDEGFNLFLVAFAFLAVQEVVFGLLLFEGILLVYYPPTGSYFEPASDKHVESHLLLQQRRNKQRFANNNADYTEGLASSSLASMSVIDIYPSTSNNNKLLGFDWDEKKTNSASNQNRRNQLKTRELLPRSSSASSSKALSLSPTSIKRNIVQPTSPPPPLASVGAVELDLNHTTVAAEFFLDFTTAFRKYKAQLLPDQLVAFQAHWMHINPYLAQYEGESIQSQIQEHNEQAQAWLWRSHNEQRQQKVAIGQELLDVYFKSIHFTQHLLLMDDKAFEHNDFLDLLVWFTYLQDVIGRHSMESKLLLQQFEGFLNYGHHLSVVWQSCNKPAVRWTVAMMIVAIDISFIAYTIVLLQPQPLFRQAEWLLLTMLVLLVDQIFIQGWTLIEKRWIIPYFLLHTLDKLQVHIKILFDRANIARRQDMFMTRGKSSVGSRANNNQQGSEFSFASQAFISVQAAIASPQLKISDIILLGTQNQAWPEEVIASSSTWPNKNKSTWQRIYREESIRGPHDSIGSMLVCNLYASYLSACPPVLQVLIRYIAFGALAFGLAELIRWRLTAPLASLLVGLGIVLFFAWVYGLHFLFHSPHNDDDEDEEHEVEAEMIPGSVIALHLNKIRSDGNVKEELVDYQILSPPSSLLRINSAIGNADIERHHHRHQQHVLGMGDGVFSLSSSSSDGDDEEDGVNNYSTRRK